MDRTPYDGKPFYCKTCGLGLGEFMACEEPDCVLETTEEAERRAALRSPVGKGAGGTRRLAEGRRRNSIIGSSAQHHSSNWNSVRHGGLF